MTCSPAKKMFRFKTGDADTPTAGARVDSPYSLSPVGRDSLLGSPLLSPKRTPRRIQRSPFKARFLQAHYALEACTDDEMQLAACTSSQPQVTCSCLGYRVPSGFIIKANVHRCCIVNAPQHPAARCGSLELELWGCYGEQKQRLAVWQMSACAATRAPAYAC